MAGTIKAIPTGEKEAVRVAYGKALVELGKKNDRVVVLLIDADDNGGHLVASRIVSSFYSECDDDAFELSYDITEICGKK